MSSSVQSGLLIKLVGPMVLISVVLIAILAYVVPNTIRDDAVDTAIDSAVSTVQQYKTIRGYYTQNVVKKVLAGSEMKPNFTHKNNADQIPLPATFIHDLSEEFSKQGMILKLYSEYPFPNRNSRQLDDFGKAAWQQLNTVPTEAFSRTEVINGSQVVRVAIADTMSAEGCVSCHNKHPDTPKNTWSLGDVRGVLEVQIPIDNAIAAGSQLSTTIIAMMVAAAASAIVIITLLFKKVIAARLSEIKDAMNAITEGNTNLSRRIEVTRQDEVGNIAQAFNHFLEQMEHSFSGVSQQTQQLSNTSADLKDIAQRTESSTQSQLSETDQVASAVNEMAATAQEVAALSNQTAEKMKDTQQDVQKSCKIVENNMAATRKLSDEMKETVAVVNRLATDSHNIGGVLDVIQSIAEQTNLLALNAAIEAARAGEQGRGFAVVADEVRTLASRTQSSTEEIKDMIDKLQNGSKQAVTTIEHSASSLEDSFESASQTNEMIRQITDSIATISNLNSQIAVAVDQQAHSSAEIDRNIKTIAMESLQSSEHSRQLLNSAENTYRIVDSINAQLRRFIN